MKIKFNISIVLSLILSICAMSAFGQPKETPAASTDFDALGSKLPKTERYVYSCGSYQGEELIPVESANNCIAEKKKYMTIQCFPGAPMNELNVALYKCAVAKSRGAPQATYRDIVTNTQNLIRKYSPECDPKVGCTGSTNLGNN